jgi:hypothetical protein
MLEISICNFLLSRPCFCSKISWRYICTCHQMPYVQVKIRSFRGTFPGRRGRIRLSCLRDIEKRRNGRRRGEAGSLSCSRRRRRTKSVRTEDGTTDQDDDLRRRNHRIGLEEILFVWTKATSGEETFRPKPLRPNVPVLNQTRSNMGHSQVKKKKTRSK